MTMRIEGSWYVAAFVAAPASAETSDPKAEQAREAD